MLNFDNRTTAVCIGIFSVTVLYMGWSKYNSSIVSKEIIEEMSEEVTYNVPEYSQSSENDESD